MSWQIPTTGQWNPGGIAQAGPMGAMVPPDMQSGNYTQEQWALMQQQNWQQWTQWQQQYAQWQSQFGEKYAQQMQAMQQMGGMPPLPPSNAPPPAPPPPDKPPPPPHENDQPLYSNSQGQPVPVSAPAATRTLAAVNSAPAQPRYPTAPNNYENNLGNNQQWSYESESRESHTQPPKPKQLQQPQQQSAQGNAEALKKLAEEERLFDIQFKKWEEEIEKWKRENVNHPDRQAYNEYEQKFEACRAQLLERRKQMNLRRAKLLGNAPQASTATIGKPSLPAANILPPQVPSTPNQNQGSLPKQNNQQQNYYSKSPQYSNQHTDLNKRNINQSAYSQGNNKNIELQDLSNSPYQETSYVTDYSETDSSFLPTSASSKGIPGLDLVSEVDKPQAPQDDVIDITQDDNTQKGPDYNTISKGINNILGDAKIMNILNMVIGQNEPPNSQVQDKQGISSKNINNSQVNSWAENRNNPAVHNQQQQFGNQQNRGPHINHPMQNNQGSVHPMQRNENKGFPMQHNQGLGMQQNQGQGSPMQWQQGPGHANQQNQRSVHSNLQNQNSSHHNELNQGPVHPNQQNQHPGQPNQQNQHPGQPNPQNQRAGHPNQLHHGPGHPNPNQSNQGPSHLNQQNQRPGHPNQQIQGSDYSNQQSQRPSLLGLPSQGPPYQNQLNQGVNQQQNFSQQGPNRNVFNNRQGHEPQDQYFNDDNGPEQGYQNQGYPNSGMQRPGRTSRPLLPNLPGQQQMCEPNVPINMGYQPEHMPPPAPVAPPPKPKWVEEPMFTPSIIVEYEHKPLRMKARDFIEPVHLFDYNHISKDDEYKNKGLNDFGKEFDEELFSKRPPRRDDDTYSRRRPSLDRYGREREPPTRDYDRERDHSSHYERERDPPRDFERRPREDLRDDWKSRAPPRDNRDDRRRPEDRYDDRRRDDRDRFGRRDEKDRERDRGRDRERDDRYKRDDDRNRSRESESRKRGPSIESDQSVAKKAKPKVNLTDPKHIVMIDDLLEQPGREIRPEKVVIILRGPPGSGKSYLAKLIRDREAEFGNTARIMSIDDYFMHEVEIEENDPATGKTVKKPSTKYEYDENLEETYLNSLKRAFKRSITDGFFPFLIFDAVNDQLKSYADVWNFARQNGFQVYICTMERDVQTCFKRNIHNRTLEDIQIICARFFETPSHHIQLDATTLLQNAAITDVHMEDADDDVIMEDQEPEVESLLTSKWEKMDDVSQLARLDGTSKPLRSSQLSMEDYLQLDEWQPSKAKPGKKSVRWADIEERREQEKMRAIGFVVGQTDWHRMTDPTMGSSALTQTKYIERVRRI